jgi:hypothetical protein
MRFLLESKDAANDRRAWTSLVAHSEGIDLVMHDIRLEFLPVFTEEDSDRLLSFFGKMSSQIEAGLWGVGDSCSTMIDGCSFHLSAIQDSRH